MADKTEASIFSHNLKSLKVLKQKKNGKYNTALKNERATSGIEILRNARKIERRWDQGSRQIK